MDSNFLNIQKSFEIQDCKDTEDISKGYKGEISGYLSVADVIDTDNEIITRHALQKALSSQQNDCIPLCFEHKMHKTLGLCEIKDANLESNGGLRITARFGLHDLAQEKYEEVKKGIYKSLSIGASVSKLEKSVKYINGRSVAIYNEILINEASIVANPANKGALIDIIKSQKNILEGVTKLEYKNILKSIFGFDVSNAILDDIYQGAHNIAAPHIRKSITAEFNAEILQLKAQILSLQNTNTAEAQTVGNVGANPAKVSQDAIFLEILERNGFTN